MTGRTNVFERVRDVVENAENENLETTGWRYAVSEDIYNILLDEGLHMIWAETDSTKETDIEAVEDTPIEVDETLEPETIRYLPSDNSNDEENITDSNEEFEYQCTECGQLYLGTKIPEQCIVCGAIANEFFEKR